MQEEWEPGTHARVLKEAARANRTDVIQAVLKHFRQGEVGATSWPDEADGSASALHIASSSGHVDAVRALLRLGAAPDAGQHAGRAPYEAATPACARAFEDELRQASAVGDVNRARSLLEGCVPCDPPAPGALGGDAPLLWACGMGHAPVAAMLLAHGANAQTRNATEGATAAHEAARGGHAGVCALLAAAGAVDLSAVGEGGYAAGKTPPQVATTPKAEDALRGCGASMEAARQLWAEVQRERPDNDGAAPPAIDAMPQDVAALTRRLEERERVVTDLRSMIANLSEEAEAHKMLLQQSGRGNLLQYLRELREKLSLAHDSLATREAVIVEQARELTSLNQKVAELQGQLERDRPCDTSTGTSTGEPSFERHDSEDLRGAGPTHAAAHALPPERAPLAPSEPAAVVPRAPEAISADGFVTIDALCDDPCGDEDSHMSWLDGLHDSIARIVLSESASRVAPQIV